MKKTILTVSVVLLFTIFFVLVFRYTSKATDVDGEEEIVKSEDAEGDIEQGEENIIKETPKTEKEIRRQETKIYIKEKIVPVVVGVLTSISAILATLGAIKRALSSIGDAKDTFKKEAKEREERFKKESEFLNKKTKEIETALSLVPRLESEVASLEKNTERLLRECRDLGKMISLGFSQDERVISSGNGQKIDRLLSELEEKSISKGSEAVK